MATYLDLMRGGVRVLKDAGVENPVREARLLMALAGDRSTASLIACERDEISDTATIARYEAFLKRRADREPFAHIAGYKHFFGLTFKSDGRALVPRPDSELLVERALDMLPRGRGVTVVDLGTGSGCLLAAILKERGGVRGIAIEVQPEAAALARENFERVGVFERVDLRVSSWTEWNGWPEVDLVISNPPYIRTEVLEGLDPEVRQYDPRSALDGGDDGLWAYREILDLSAEKLRPGTALIFEIGFDQGPAIRSLMERAGFTDVSVLKDFSGHDRVVSAKSRSANSLK